MSVNNMDSMMSVNTINSLLKQAWGVESISTTKTQLFVSDATKTLVAGSYKGLILKLIATINPKQSGSGDPSPDNVRPISGWDNVQTSVSGKNMADMVADGKTPSISTGALVSYPQSTHSQMIKVNPSTAYVAFFGNTLFNGVFLYDKDGNFIRADQTKTTTIAVTTTSTTAFIMLRCDRNSASDPIPNCQFELGSTATDYEPYQADTYTTDLPETVYGGTLDVVNGVLNIKPYYASYNGETLSGEWISDRDVYSEGGMPTIGAQVVNVGATGTNVQLTPKQVTTLLGTNKVWADSGDVTVEYWGDTGTIKTDSGRIVTFNII